MRCREKKKTNIESRDGRNVSIFDVIKDKVESARKDNKNGRSLQKAPDGISDKLKKEIEYKQRRSLERKHSRVEERITDIIHEYNIDVRFLYDDVLRQIQRQYAGENQALEVKYARFMQHLNT